MRGMVFSCFTPYQLMNSIFYAVKLKKYDSYLIWQDYANYGIDLDKFKSYFKEIMVIPYYMNNDRMKKQYLKCLHSGYLFGISKEYDFLKRFEHSIMVIFSDQEPSCNRQIRCFCRCDGNKVMLVEEGIGTYCGEPQHLSLKVKLIYSALGIHTQPYIGASEHISTMIVKHPELLDKKRYKCNNFVSQSNILFDNQFMNELNIIDLPNKEKKSTKKTALFLGGPLQERGVSEREYIEKLKEIFKILNDDYDIIVKPHPRENIEYYTEIPNISIMNRGEDKWIPFELMIKKIQFEILLTTVSSAAFNAYEIKSDIKVIYLYKLFKGLTLDDQIIQKYGKMNNIYIPANIEMLKTSISSPLLERDIHFDIKNDDIVHIKKIMGD